MNDVALNNLTPKAQQVLALARREAGRLNHNYLGTEHLLLGIIKLGESTAIDVLKSFGTVNLDTLKEEIENKTGTGSDQQIVIEKIPYTPRVKKVLCLASKQAVSLNHTYVGTEHILLGILQEGDGLAARVLGDMGVGPTKARLRLLEILDPNLQKPEDKEKEPVLPEINDASRIFSRFADPEPDTFPENYVKGLTLSGTSMGVEVQTALEKLKVAALRELIAWIPQKEKIFGKNFDGLVFHTMVQSLSEEVSLEQLRLWHHLLEKITEGKSEADRYLKDLFLCTEHGSFAERNIGALLQMCTNAPVERTIKTDFLAMWPKEEREEKPPQPQSPQG